MPIAAFNIEKINVERKAIPRGGNLKILPDIFVNDIKKEDISSLDKKQGALRFNFEYSLRYEPGIGSLLFAGHIIFIDEASKIDTIHKDWQKNKRLPKELIPLIINTIHIRSSLKAFQLEQEVGLPPHLRIPILKVEPKTKKDYIG